MSKKYTIGTRGSLLALTQCNLIKNQIESLANITFDIKTLKTQGDQITNKPLWQLEGKDFFTKELDAALIAKEIDLVVHSYKDLGSERPAGIEIACVTERKFAHDILLIKKDKIKELHNKSELIVGTSSPRRIFNLQTNLSRYLPNNQIKVECKMLRGNVNTRIEKLRRDEYDAIVLAYAGLERLASSKESAEILKGLLKDINFMILPQKDFPSSASQGALAIEYLEENKELASSLEKVHHEQTAQEIKREREAFKEYGGGCHLPVGIHVKSVQDFFLHFHHGEQNGVRFKKQKLEGFSYKGLKGKKTYFVFGRYDFLTKKIPIELDNASKAHFFVTSSLCTHNIKNHETIWSAGNRTMKKLISEGYWVNGSAEGFGHGEVNKFKTSNLMKLFTQNENWVVLSHDHAQSEVGEVLPSYKHQLKKAVEKKYKDEMMAADIVYWSSSIQYELYTKQYPELLNKLHACGLGKTYIYFKENNINVIPCMDMNHLENLVRTPNE